MNFNIIISNLAVIFLLIAVGFAAGRAKIVSSRAQGDFTAFLMNVTLPCTIFSSMVREYDPSLIRDSLIIFAMGIVIFGGGMLLYLQVSRLFRVPQRRRNVWTLSAALCNIGFMGFPLVKAIFGDDGLFLASIMNLSYNCVAWSLGTRIICMNEAEKGKIPWKKILLTNNNYAVVLGLIVFLTQIPMPQVVMTVVNHFGGITTPLSMFLIGLTLSGGRIAEVFRDRDVWTVTFARLILSPLVIVLLLHILPLPAGSPLPGIVTLIMAMPGPSVCLMLAQQYGQDSDFAAKAIFFSSLCCIVTIPLIMMLI